MSTFDLNFNMTGDSAVSSKIRRLTGDFTRMASVQQKFVKGLPSSSVGGMAKAAASGGGGAGMISGMMAFSLASKLVQRIMSNPMVDKAIMKSYIAVNKLQKRMLKYVSIGSPKGLTWTLDKMNKARVATGFGGLGNVAGLFPYLKIVAVSTLLMTAFLSDFFPKAYEWIKSTAGTLIKKAGKGLSWAATGISEMVKRSAFNIKFGLEQGLGVNLNSERNASSLIPTQAAKNYTPEEQRKNIKKYMEAYSTRFPKKEAIDAMEKRLYEYFDQLSEKRSKSIEDLMYVYSRKSRN